MYKYICILFLFLTSSVNSQVTLCSFYFVDGNTTLSKDSEEKLRALDTMQHTHIVQIIELDAFSTSGNSLRESKKIAEKQIGYFLSLLHQEGDDITIINYGNRKIPIVFEATSWNRIDIYYNLRAKADLRRPLIKDSIPVVLPKIDTLPLVVREEPNKIERNVPIVVPIAFKGGKTKINESSYPVIESLYETLLQHPDLNAHIRGHVCCEPKVGKSRKRAKNVYKMLIKKGISAARLSFDGYGNSLPIISPEITEKDRKTNRRVDIIFK